MYKSKEYATGGIVLAQINCSFLTLCVIIALAAGLLNSLLTNGGFRFWQTKNRVLDLGVLQDVVAAGLAGGVAYFWFWPTDVRQASISILAGVSPAWLINAIRSRAEAASAEDQATAQQEVSLGLLNLLDDDDELDEGVLDDAEKTAATPGSNRQDR